jgi:hypothetical protein
MTETTLVANKWNARRASEMGQLDDLSSRLHHPPAHNGTYGRLRNQT